MKRVLRKRVITLFLSIIILGTSNNTRSDAAVPQFNPQFDLQWCNSGDFNYLVGASGKELEATYAYNSNWERSEKTVNGVTTYFVYQDSMLLSEERNSEMISYLYPSDSLYWYDVIGFEYNGDTYYYEKDDNTNNVIGIKCDGELLVQYVYDQGIVRSVLGFEDGEWVDKSDDYDFIGNINLIRYNSYYFDTETNWYYYGGAYFNTVQNCFVSKNTESGFDNKMRALPPQSTIDFAYASNLKSFGGNISYTSGWYNNLSNAEIFARLIYGEADNDVNNQKAIAWVVLNRLYYNTSEFGGSTLNGVMTKSGAWQAIIGDTTNTNAARNPDITSQRWKNAVYYTTIVSISTIQTDVETVITKPSGITTHKFVNTRTYFLQSTVTKNGTNCIQYNFAGTWSDLTKCNVAGNSTAYTKTSSIPNTASLVFFDYK